MLDTLETTPPVGGQGGGDAGRGSCGFKSGLGEGNTAASLWRTSTTPPLPHLIQWVLRKQVGADFDACVELPLAQLGQGKEHRVDLVPSAPSRTSTVLQPPHPTRTHAHTPTANHRSRIAQPRRRSTVKRNGVLCMQRCGGGKGRAGGEGVVGGGDTPPVPTVAACFTNKPKQQSASAAHAVVGRSSQTLQRKP